jgi:dolichol kinase
MNFINEFKRKSIHIFSLIIPVIYWMIPDEFVSKIILFSLTLLLLVGDILRLRIRLLKRMYFYIFKKIVRVHEMKTIHGATYLMIASCICVTIFEKPVAVAALAFLIVGDTTAALFGKTFGRIRILNKTLEGSLACFLSCQLIVLCIPGFNHKVGMVGALVATVAEFFPLPIDDNFRIPLSSGFVMQMLL